MPRNTRAFLAVDGEAIDNPKTGEHVYNLLVTSTDAYLDNPRGIGTLQALAFLSRLKHDNPNTILVGFWFGYDVNMILRDMPWPALEVLWKRGSVFWKGWRVDWMPGKYFGAAGPLGEKFRLYDVHGFFQGSFLKALASWGIGDAKRLAIIERGKLARGTFTAKGAAKTLEYARTECDYLAELCEALRSAFAQAGFQPVGWYGAGAAAAGLMKNEGVRAHITPDTELRPDVLDICERAYFGGRVELLLQGEHKRAYSHDLASAYPAALASMPTNRGKWRKVRKPDGPLDTNGIYLCRWNLDALAPVMPFPHRTKGNIYYPTHGEGWYHSVEIEAARALHPSIEVCRGYVFVPESAALPFAFVPQLFEERREAKRLGEAREKAYKLALNSLYGKLAQRQGWRDDPPPYRCTYWAGRITAWTRAQLLLKVAEAPDAIISFATDGILSTSPLSADDTGELGSWESETWENVLTVQPGVYFGSRDGKPIFKSRGWNAKEIDTDTLRFAWRSQGPAAELTVPARRFVGLGMALHRNDRSAWRSWPDTTRDLRFAPSRKFPDPDYRPGRGVHRLLHNAGPRFEVVSEPFRQAAPPPPDES
jgi:DNA polymerase type B, organellar and viral